MSIHNTDQSTSKPCVSCAIFYGTQASNWLCSGCCKQKANQSKRKESTFTDVSQKAEILTVEVLEDKKQQPKIDKSRCFQCNKKVGLLGVECKCTMVFCNTHRMPETHLCGIDYKKIGKQKLTKQHQLVAPSKISEI